MKKLAQLTVIISLLAIGSGTFANPKCSHRLASSGNDLLKSTNPIKVASAKAVGSKSMNGKSQTRSGIR